MREGRIDTCVFVTVKDPGQELLAFLHLPRATFVQPLPGAATIEESPPSRVVSKQDSWLWACAESAAQSWHWNSQRKRVGGQVGRGPESAMSLWANFEPLQTTSGAMP